MGFFVPLLLGAGKLLAKPALMTGLGAAGIVGAGKYGFGGYKLEDLARDEDVDLTNPTRVKDYSLGDRFVDTIAGYSEKDRALKRAEQLREQLQKKTYGRLTTGLTSRYNKLGLGDAFDPVMAEGVSKTSYDQRLQDDLERVNALEYLQSKNKDVNLKEYLNKPILQINKDAENFSEASDVVSKLNQLGKYGQFELGKITDPTNLSAVQQGLANALEAKQGDVNNPLSPGAALQREKSRFVTGQQRLDKEFNQRGQELDRANQLAMMTLQNQIANQQQNFNLTRMEMDYRNRREDRMDERNRRKEEQAMIMMLIRGLTQGVGNAFN